MASADEPPNKSDSDADWHPADILAALKKRGHSLAGLSVANGYHPTAAGKALKTPWPTRQTRPPQPPLNMYLAQATKCAYKYGAP